MKYNKYIDHTLLKADASQDEITTLCKEAMQYDFMSVCVNPTWVSYCKNLLASSNVEVCTVIGFPLGAATTATKVFEVKDAIKNGATEIDMVINIAWLKAGKLTELINEIRQIKLATGKHVLKVIVETCLLSEQQKNDACKVVINGNADFIKTSTGFSTGGATVADIKLFKSQVGDKILIKASGGVKTFQDMVDMINAGANRIGTSRGVSLIQKQ